MNHSLSFQTFNSIAASDVMSMTIVKQCMFLEEKPSSNSSFTNEVLTQSSVSIRDLKKRILSHDRSRTLQLSESHPSLHYPLIVVNQNMWVKFWDIALEHGVSSTKSALSALKLLSPTVFSDGICPVDECNYILPENSPLCTHFMHTHTNLPADYTPDLLTNLILSIGIILTSFMS